LKAAEKFNQVSTPKTVVFDLGKVLLDFDYTIAARKLLSAGKISIGQLSKLFTTPGDILLRYETGLISTTDFYKEICAITGYNQDMEAFAACFGDVFTPIQPLIDAQAEIKRRGIPTYILSNTNELAIRHIKKTYAFMRNFDGLVLSYEHRSMKPEHPLYEVVERVSGFTGGDIAYIDDRPENVATARERGWRGIVQERPDKTLQALRSLGVI
jgi:FMN phosphatase YigB (HAD superfamily)